jgi:hypothetical protein
VDPAARGVQPPHNLLRLRRRPRAGERAGVLGQGAGSVVGMILGMGGRAVGMCGIGI